MHRVRYRAHKEMFSVFFVTEGALIQHNDCAWCEMTLRFHITNMILASKVKYTYIFITILKTFFSFIDHWCSYFTNDSLQCSDNDESFISLVTME